MEDRGKKMNKLKCFLITILMMSVALVFTSCGSTDTDETVISTVEANHITVNVTKSNVLVTLSKLEGEVIETIEVVDEQNGCQATVKMDEAKVTFLWPFAQAGKEYTLTAKIYEKSKYQEETVSFKVENDMASLFDFSDDYNNAQISLIAKSNERLIKIDTPYNTISSVFSSAKIENSKFVISLYSGKHYKAQPSESTLVGKIVKDFSNKSVLDPFKNGFDIIKNAKDFGYTASDLNTTLRSKQTYFAVAQVQFTLPSAPSSVNFVAQGIYSNDTIYTPIAEKDLPQETILSAGDAK